MYKNSLNALTKHQLNCKYFVTVTRVSSKLVHYKSGLLLLKYQSPANCNNNGINAGKRRSYLFGKHVTNVIKRFASQKAQTTTQGTLKTSVIGRVTLQSNATANERSPFYDANCFTEFYWTKAYQSSDVTLPVQ